MFVLNCRGRILTIESPIVMGILNITPDSFYKSFSLAQKDQILSTAEKMVQEGATIIDIGGQSTKPGSKRIDADEELGRVLPVIEALQQHFPQIFLSIDTFHSKVAREAVAAGVAIVNDISSGLMDPEMIPTVANLQVPYISMHMQGTPENMQVNPHYNNILEDMFSFFEERLNVCKNAGIKDIIIDPGFGFGKTIAHNFQLLNGLNKLLQFETPLLVGLSRKSMVYKVLNNDADSALNGTTVLHTIALLKGASILRVHDVKQAVESISLIDFYKKNR